VPPTAVRVNLGSDDNKLLYLFLREVMCFGTPLPASPITSAFVSDGGGVAILYVRVGAGCAAVGGAVCSDNMPPNLPF
jgi:hypothetical protein